MAKRSYNQYCGIAVALDLLGERWTLLVVRNLLLGPQRFTDLADALPGIGTALLTERLRQLQDVGVVTRVSLPPPAASTVYQLTGDGERLRPVLIGLDQWGLDHLAAPDDRQLVTPDLLAIGLQARFDPAHADKARGTYELRIEDHGYRVDIDDDVHVRRTPVEAPQATITTDTATLIALNTGALTLTAALDEQSITVTGDTDRLPALADAFKLPLT